jgi:predicted RNase H-like nuclease
MTVVGVDGCRSGWVAVGIGADLGDATGLEAALIRDVSEIPDRFPDVTVVAIDMPIGLGSATFREADSLARERLGQRGSSVFATPPRAVLETEEHAAASALCVELTGKGVSRQAHGLRHKILELDRWQPDAACVVREAHPELCFAEMMGHPARHTKRSWGGLAERLRALQRAGLDPLSLPEDPAAVAPDDLLDAFAAAWTATRLARGRAHSLPDPPELLDSGEWAAIWT